MAWASPFFCASASSAANGKGRPAIRPSIVSAFTWPSRSTSSTAPAFTRLRWFSSAELIVGTSPEATSSRNAKSGTRMRKLSESCPARCVRMRSRTLAPTCRSALTLFCIVRCPARWTEISVPASSSARTAAISQRRGAWKVRTTISAPDVEGDLGALAVERDGLRGRLAAHLRRPDAHRVAPRLEVAQRGAPVRRRLLEVRRVDDDDERTHLVMDVAAERHDAGFVEEHGIRRAAFVQRELEGLGGGEGVDVVLDVVEVGEADGRARLDGEDVRDEGAVLLLHDGGAARRRHGPPLGDGIDDGVVHAAAPVEHHGVDRGAEERR